MDLVLRLVLRAFISYPLLVQFNEVARCLLEIVMIGSLLQLLLLLLGGLHTL